MDDLVTWLREQIAATKQSSVERDDSGICDWQEGIHFDHGDVLAQCEAHTAILDRAQFVDDHGPARDSVRAMDMTSGASSALRDVLCFLALAYQHYPGYREEWRP